MKNKVYISKNDNMLDFYLKTNTGTYFLFKQECTKGVYEYFKNGRSVDELRAYHQWERNKRLDKTVEKLPSYVTYAVKYLAY